jgi:hypothetical protein
MDKKKISSEYQQPEYMHCTVSDPETVRDETGKPLHTTYLISTEVITRSH